MDSSWSACWKLGTLDWGGASSSARGRLSPPYRSLGALQRSRPPDDGRMSDWTRSSPGTSSPEHLVRRLRRSRRLLQASWSASAGAGVGGVGELSSAGGGGGELPSGIGEDVGLLSAGGDGGELSSGVEEDARFLSVCGDTGELPSEEGFELLTSGDDVGVLPSGVKPGRGLLSVGGVGGLHWEGGGW